MKSLKTLGELIQTHLNDLQELKLDFFEYILKKNHFIYFKKSCHKITDEVFEFFAFKIGRFTNHRLQYLTLRFSG